MDPHILSISECDVGIEVGSSGLNVQSSLNYPGDVKLGKASEVAEILESD